MLFVEFWQASATRPTVNIPASGDRSVIILDARTKWPEYVTGMSAEGMKRGYTGMMFHHGDSLSRLHPCSEFIKF